MYPANYHVIFFFLKGSYRFRCKDFIATDIHGKSVDRPWTVRIFHGLKFLFGRHQDPTLDAVLPPLK